MQATDSIDDVIERYKNDVDVTLLVANLRHSPEVRILRLQELARFADQLRRAGEKFRVGL